MCIIIYKPGEVWITKRTLRTCWNNNSDGAGFMFATDGKLQVQKGYMRFKTFWKAYRTAFGENYESPFVIHFRIGTSGTLDEHMTHPFQVNDNLGFAHNGILSDYSSSKYKTLSDTALFTYIVLRKMPADFLQQEGTRQLLESYASKCWSKFVFLDNVGVAYIMNEKDGVWDGDCWYSNKSFKEYKKAAANYCVMDSTGTWQSYDVYNEDAWGMNSEEWTEYMAYREILTDEASAEESVHDIDAAAIELAKQTVALRVEERNKLASTTGSYQFDDHVSEITERATTKGDWSYGSKPIRYYYGEKGRIWARTKDGYRKLRLDEPIPKEAEFAALPAPDEGGDE